MNFRRSTSAIPNAVPDPISLSPRRLVSIGFALVGHRFPVAYPPSRLPESALDRVLAESRGLFLRRVNKTAKRARDGFSPSTGGSRSKRGFRENTVYRSYAFLIRLRDYPARPAVSGAFRTFAGFRLARERNKDKSHTTYITAPRSPASNDFRERVNVVLFISDARV